MPEGGARNRGKGWGGEQCLRRRTDPFRGPWKLPALKTRLDLASRGGRVYVTNWPENESGNFCVEGTPSCHLHVNLMGQ
jgi:hypothetical protein